MSTRDAKLSVSLELTGERRVADDTSLQQRVQWLEELVGAASVALVGSRAEAALTDLRAALGAIVQWGRGPRTP